MHTGFRERSAAFDLKAVLDDFVRFLDRQKRAEEISAVEVRKVCTDCLLLGHGFIRIGFAVVARVVP